MEVDMVKGKNSSKQVVVAGRSTQRAVARRRSNRLAKWVIIAVIGLAMIAVIVALVCSLALDNEKMVKAKMDELAKSYYEEYIYENLIDESMDEAEIAKKMELYKVKGFSPVNLRQLLIHDERRAQKEVDYIRYYCDENKTSIKFFPEEPYGRQDYRIEFRYSCEF